MNSPESGPRGSKPDPLAFFPGVCSGGYLFSSGVQPSQPPANFYPGLHCTHLSHRRVALRYPVLSRQMSPPAIPYMTVHKTIIFDRQHYWRSKPMRHFFAERQ